MDINLDELEKACVDLGQNLLPEQLEKLKAYLELLFKWNKKINLTGADKWQNALRMLVSDSFYLRAFIAHLPPLSQNANIWDLGSGAGLPGIPLRILWSEGFYHMVELREKRAMFLQTALAYLQPLPATFAHKADAEKFMQEQQRKNLLAQMVISRAFMPWQKLLSFVKPFLAAEGIVILMLGSDAPPYGANGGREACEGTEAHELDDWQVLGRKEYCVASTSPQRQLIALGLR